ncbi:MAG: type II secretion system protein [Sedimentisphaerales bacterium]|nr:type II secretion system protein [Sedimentisphaerales bacterium]
MPKLICHSAHGFSYVEVLFAAVLLAVLFTAGMTLYGNLGRAGQDTIDQDLAAELALEMIKEIKVHPYVDPQFPDDGIGRLESPPRKNFDDVDDYDEWTATPPQNPEGEELSRYTGLTRTVTVEHVSPANFEQVLGDDNDQGVKRVTITIKRGEREIARQIYILVDVPDDMIDDTET